MLSRNDPIAVQRQCISMFFVVVVFSPSCLLKTKASLPSDGSSKYEFL